VVTGPANAAPFDAIHVRNPLAALLGQQSLHIQRVPVGADRPDQMVLNYQMSRVIVLVGF